MRPKVDEQMFPLKLANAELMRSQLLGQWWIWKVPEAPEYGLTGNNTGLFSGEIAPFNEVK